MIWKLKIFFTCQTWPFTITRFLWSLAARIMCSIPGTWHDSLTVTGTIIQWLTRFFNSCWHHCSTVTGTIVQQTLARLFNSHWQDYSTVAGRIIHQSLAPLFNSHWHHCSTATGKISSFFYAGRILQQWCSLLKNRAMYQEYDVRSKVRKHILNYDIKEQGIFSDTQKMNNQRSHTFDDTIKNFYIFLVILLLVKAFKISR